MCFRDIEIYLYVYMINSFGLKFLGHKNDSEVK